jgi:hypothetical protein
VAGLSTLQIVALLVPVLLIELTLKLIAFLDLEKEERLVLGGSKIAWALVILLISLIGPLLYLTVGRRND